MDVVLEPTDIGFDPAAVADLRERLARTRHTGSPGDDWGRGVPSSWLAGVLADWAAFDIAAFERQLGGLTHRRARIDGHDVHVVLAGARGPDALPLLLANGWPSSFCEYLDVLPLLTDPGAHGADPRDAFSVVVPVAPGFGFSAAPPAGGITAAGIADLWQQLMDALGHPRFVAHGSDLGAGVVGQLARRHSAAVAGIHLATPSIPVPPGPWTPLEQAYADEVAAWGAEEGGYAHEHSTKPDTLGAALNDSPAGLAAWIGEKAVAWSSRTDDGEPAFARALLLQTLTIYWFTGSIGTSMLPYWIHRHTDGAALPPDDQPAVPTALTNFGGEQVPLPKPPREVAERFYDIVGWSEHGRGGHFPAAAEPELFARTLREAFRPMRAR